MKISAYHIRVTDGLRAGEAVSFPYKAGDAQSDFDTTAGANVLLVDTGAGVDQKTFAGVLVDATDTFLVTYGAAGITIQWRDRLRAVGDTDELILVCNLLSTSGGGADMVTTDAVQTLINKTMDGDLNTFQDLPITALKTLIANANKALVFDASGAPITIEYSAASVANAIVRLDATGLLALALLPYTQTAAANKLIATDGTGKLPTALIPDSLLGMVQYKGDWNASTNTPTIPAAATANKGWYYVVSTAGSTNVSGVTDWNIGDWLVSDGTKWAKIDNTEPLATDTIAGLIEIATQAEVDGGADTGRAVVAATLASTLVNVARTYVKAQGYSFQATAYAANITWDVQGKPATEITATGNPSITATNVENGKVYTLRFVHSGAARTITWDTNVFKFGDDGQPTLSTAADKVDYITFIGRTGGYLDHMGYKTGF